MDATCHGDDDDDVDDDDDDDVCDDCERRGFNECNPRFGLNSSIVTICRRAIPSAEITCSTRRAKAS